MLKLKPNCECCDRDLPPESAEARICTFECTFCATCADSVFGGSLPQLRRQPGGAAGPAGGDAGEVSGLDRALSARCAVRHAGGGIDHCAASRVGDWAKKVAAWFSALASLTTSPGLLP